MLVNDVSPKTTVKENRKHNIKTRKTKNTENIDELVGMSWMGILPTTARRHFPTTSFSMLRAHVIYVYQSSYYIENDKSRKQTFASVASRSRK